MTEERRICYFGTRGWAGHSAYPIVGDFSREELDRVTDIDSHKFHSAMAKNGFIYGTFGNFMFYAIPHSIDDKRPLCVSALFVEYAKTPNDIREVIMSAPEFIERFSYRYPNENDLK